MVNGCYTLCAFIFIFFIFLYLCFHISISISLYLAEGGHRVDRKSSIIWPILRHLLPIMVKLFISSAAKTEEETLGRNHIIDVKINLELSRNPRTAESGIHLMIEALPAQSNQPWHETKIIPRCPKSGFAISEGSFSFIRLKCTNYS